MPDLIRRRYPERVDCWQIYYGDVRVGTIARRTDCPNDVDQWEWGCLVPSAGWASTAAWAAPMGGDPTKPFFRTDEAALKRRCATISPIKQRGSVMLDIIISLFYHQSCRAPMSAIRTHKHLWG
jgi:hypothetical protein